MLALVVCALSTRTGTQSSTSAPSARPFFHYTSVLPLGTPGPNDGAADIALFENIRDVVISPAGVMYVADGHAVRRIAADGAVTTIAGSVTEAGEMDGSGLQARFRNPGAIAAAANGVVLVADTGNHTIRQIAVDGTVTTVAGRAGLGGNANGQARHSRLLSPNGIVVHPSGAVYFTEQNCLLRRLTTAQVVELVSGAPGVCGSTDGTGGAARLAGPVALAVDAAGVLYVAESNHTLRRITADGVVTTLAGTPGVYGTQDGAPGEARLSFPRDVTVTPSGAVRVLESWSVESSGGSHSMNVGQAAIRDVAPEGTLTRVRFLGASAWATLGRGLAYDAAGLAYWVHEQYFGPAVELMAAQGTGAATTWSGSGAGRSSRTGTTVTTDASGIVELARVAGDGWRVRRISLDGTVTTPLASLPDGESAGELQALIAASGETIAVVRRQIVLSPDVSTIQRVVGGVTQSFASVPAQVRGLAAAPDGGFIAVADRAVYAVSTAGVVRAIAGDGQTGYVDGPAASARFDSPQGAVVAPNGDVLVADSGNHVLRRISADGQVSTVAGVPRMSGWTDGPASSARFNAPRELALASDGSLIVNDQGGRALRRVPLSGAVSTVAAPAGSLAGTTGVAQTITGMSDGRIVRAAGHGLWIGTLPSPVALTLTEPPASQAVLTGDDAVFSLVASGAPAPTVEWQQSLDGGNTWEQVSPPASAIGGRYTLVVRAVTAGMHGRQYRALVVDADESMVSTPVTLSVTGLGVDVTSLSFLATAPSSGAFGAAAQPITLTVPVEGTPWTLTADQSWLTVTPGSGTGAATVAVSVSAAGMTDGQTMYGSLRLTAPSLEPVVVPVQVRALRAPGITSQPRDSALVATSAWFSVRISGLEYTTRWEQSDDGVNWIAAEGSSGFGLSEWWLNVPNAVDGRWYRLVATNAAGATATTAVRSRRPTMAADRTTIDFRGWRDRTGAMRFVTLTSQVQLTDVSWWTTRWSLASPVPWLEITPSSATGPGTITMTLKPEWLPAGAEWTASLQVVASLLSQMQVDNLTVASISVRVTAPSDSAGPFGQVDTPAQSTTGVQGSVAMTGWVLDDIGVASVDIYRECFPFDVAGTCESIVGRSVVYVGRATIVPGARPDVAAAYAGWPDAGRAGWGFLMLTPMLPHVPAGRLYGGQGPITIYAIATDVEGTRRLLGRSADPRDPASGMPTTMTLANDSIARPFGAIDSPAQGATVSGLLHNFGWVLTPDTNTIADPTDIVIPSDGSGVTVFIDGVARGTVSFNFCRGSAGPTVSPGSYCDDDVASVFGHVIPQPLLTPRSSNPTAHRNLDAGRGAIGVFSIDTTALSNGLHAISWGVTDSAGRTEGLGSRFFTVDNPAAPRAAARADRLDAGGVRALPAAAQGVWARTGFDLSTPWTNVRPTDAGDYAVAVPEAGRLELWLGAPVSAAFMVLADGLMALPDEATLDGARFSWAPPAGYLGEYRLIFVRGAERIEFLVRIGRQPGR